MRFVHPYAIFSEMFEQKFLKFVWTQHGLQLSHPALWSHRGCLHTSLLSSFLLLISQNIAKHCRRAMWFLLPVYFEELFIFQGRNIPGKIAFDVYQMNFLFLSIVAWFWDVIFLSNAFVQKHWYYLHVVGIFKCESEIIDYRTVEIWYYLAFLTSSIEKF